MNQHANDDQTTSPPAGGGGNDDQTTDEQRDGLKVEPDEQPPFGPPDDVKDRLGSTHQGTDTGMDETELYNEHNEGAADAELPAEPAVIGYEPDKDTRLKEQSQDEFDAATEDMPKAA